MSVKSIIPKQILQKYSEDPDLFNKLVVTAFIRNNNITEYNDFIREHIIQNDSDFGLDMFVWDGVKSLEDVINLFELAIPKENAVVNGAVYTPKYIREYIVNHTVNKFIGDIDQISIADISCGCGAFLLSVADYLVANYGWTYVEAYNHITGIDIDEQSIIRSKILMSLQSSQHEETVDANALNLHVSNTLAFDFGDNKYDVIVGNPPYVRSKNIDDESKSLMNRWDVCKCGNSDLYIPFFQIAMSLLSDDGILGFITVNSFLKSVNARALRQYFTKGQYDITIANFGEELVFKGKLAYTCLFFAEKRVSQFIKYARVSSDTIKAYNPINYTSVEFTDLDCHKGWNLNNGKIMDTVTKIESIGTPLGEAFNIKNGIATLANDIFIFHPVKEDKDYYYLQIQGIGIQRVEKAICRDIVKPNILKSEDELDEKTEKLIFPYNDDGSLISEESFINEYPFAYNYLNLHRETLLKRDKGKCDYPWYAFGRTQAINNKGIKLLFPYMTDVPHFVFTRNEDMLIYCGYAIYGESERDLLVLKKILESSIFNFYMHHTAKPYSTGYYSYAKNYVKAFGVVELSEEEKAYLLQLSTPQSVTEFLCGKYNISQSAICV